MNNVYVCESCGVLYAAFIYKDKPEPHRCEIPRKDKPGVDGICSGKLTRFGHVEPWVAIGRRSL
jgi:hypothetical protein